MDELHGEHERVRTQVLREKVVSLQHAHGNVSVSGVVACGVTAVGLFSEGPGALYAEGPAKGLLLGGGASQLITQCIGIVTVGATALVVTSALWYLVKAICGLRVTVEEETTGLDTSEHGQVAYVAAQ